MRSIRGSSVSYAEALERRRDFLMISTVFKFLMFMLVFNAEDGG